MQANKLNRPGVPWEVEAIWGARPESVDQVSDRVVATFTALRELHPHLREWFGLPNSDKRPREFPLQLDKPSAVRQFVVAGQERSDYQPFEVVPRLGYALHGYNAQLDTNHVVFSISCGLQGDAVANRVTFEWTDTGCFLRNLDPLVRVIEVLASAWAPDFIAVAGRVDPKVRKVHWVRWNPFLPTVGWLLYVGHRRLTSADVPSAWRVSQCPPDGSLVIVRREFVDMSIARDFALAEKVRIELGLPPPYTVGKPP